MATVDLGKISFVNKGTYDANTTYEERDVVQFTDGALSSYVYINASAASGQTPSTGGTVNSSHWSLFAGGVSIGVGNNKIVTTNSSGTATGLSIGTASQVLKVNASANGFEFGSGFSALSDGHLFFDNAGAHGAAGPSATALALRYIDQPLITGASFGNLATDGAGSQVWTVYEAGTYYMELAGAMGGGNGGGGDGGIVWGQKTLAVGDKLHIRVGQIGNIGQSTNTNTPLTNPYDASRFSNSNTTSTSYGGYGGSKGGQSSQFAGSGGGSTDIRLRLANGNNFAGATFSDGLADRMAVAGAGGGCYIEATSGSSHTGWYGGGQGGGTVGTGGQGQSGTSRGGTQSGGGTSDSGSTGTQAQGGNAYTGNDSGGGGGGYWGGGGGGDNGAGGGGSGSLEVLILTQADTRLVEIQVWDTSR